jgi:hypothetical protein
MPATPCVTLSEDEEGQRYTCRPPSGTLCLRHTPGGVMWR